MRPVTDRFLEAVRHSHVAVTQAVVLDGDVELAILDVVSGTVTLDRTAAIRGRADLVVAAYDVTTGVDLTPRFADDPLSPYGFEVQVRRGIRYANGDEELIGLGVYATQLSGIASGGDVRLAGLDRAQKVSDARFTDAFAVPAGEAFEDAIQAVIEGVNLSTGLPVGDGVAGLPFDFISTGETTPALAFDPQQNRWEEAQKMARDVGCELYFDGDGVCVLREEPDLSAGTPVFEIVEGPTGTLSGLDVELDRSPAFNWVIASGQNASTQATYRGEALDNDPTSPTYVLGRFGPKPTFFSSPFFTSNNQCRKAARGRLLAEVGIARHIHIETAPVPPLEPSDLVVVDRTRAGVVNEVHVLDSETIGLGATGTHTCETRARQVLDVGS